MLKNDYGKYLMSLLDNKILKVSLKVNRK